MGNINTNKAFILKEPGAVVVTIGFNDVMIIKIKVFDHNFILRGVHLSIKYEEKVMFMKWD